jgi:hypothetical protein
LGLYTAHLFNLDIHLGLKLQELLYGMSRTKKNSKKISTQVMEEFLEFEASEPMLSGISWDEYEEIERL